MTSPEERPTAPTDREAISLPTGIRFRSGSQDVLGPDSSIAYGRRPHRITLHSSLADLGRKGRGAPAALIVTAMVAAVTAMMAALQGHLHGHRPPFSFYLIPIAFAAATLGRVWALAVTAIVAALSFLIVYVDFQTRTIEANSIDVLTMTGAVFGALLVVLVVGRLRDSLDELAAANEELYQADSRILESEERRIDFNREVLLAVTGGRLLLCDDDEMAGALVGERLMHWDLGQPKDVSEARLAARDLLVERKLIVDRLADFEACATEAATNAIRHGGAGYIELWADETTAMALVVDSGRGIEPHQLARATLERGFSTQVSLGLGFKLMWELADKIAISTGPVGTAVLVTVGDKPRMTPEDEIVSRYPSLDT